MQSISLSLEAVQKLVVDVQKVERNHSIPGTDHHENVIEHSFSVAMLCWKIFDSIQPPLDISKVLKYALAHDFTERGLAVDINTYAPADQVKSKKERESAELNNISYEFQDFEDLVATLRYYEKLDPEALFVWTVDKMQAIILGGMDDWRPYRSYGVTYKQFCDKGKEFITKGSPYLKRIMTEIVERGSERYYDNPNRKNSA